MCAGGRICVGMNYMNEFLPYKWQTVATTTVNTVDAVTMIY